MYYLYYGIWFGIKSRLSSGVILGIELGCLGLVVLVGISMMITALYLFGV